MTEIKIKFEFVDHDKVILTNQNGDTYTSKSEGLMDFLHSTKPESLPAPTQDGTAEEIGEKNKVFYSALKYTHDLPIRNMKLFKSLAFEMMSDFAAPIRAEIEEKNKRISEQAEKLRFSHDRIGELKSELAASQQRVAELEEAIKWALGENGEFVGREVGQGAFWWRTELRRRSKF